MYIGDMYLPGKQTSGAHLFGTAAWLMFGAILCAFAVLLSLVVDHYDRRNNEHHYWWFKRCASIVGWIFFGAALVWGLFGPRA
jgi:hypothetical protein